MGEMSRVLMVSTAILAGTSAASAADLPPRSRHRSSSFGSAMPTARASSTFPAPTPASGCRGGRASRSDTRPPTAGRERHLEPRRPHRLSRPRPDQRRCADADELRAPCGPSCAWRPRAAPGSRRSAPAPRSASATPSPRLGRIRPVACSNTSTPTRRSSSSPVSRRAAPRPSTISTPTTSKSSPPR